MTYDILKIIHIIAVICWMAGLFYLPRLFVYHVEEAKKYNAEPLFLKMQDKLYRFIMQPSLVITFLSGLYLAYDAGFFKSPWFHMKFLAVFLMAIFHFYLRGIHKKLLRNDIPFSGRYLRMINEIPTVLLIVIVILVVLKN
ncbi:MAG: hypothetical protein NEHIOOID_00207 [Holosporales bacterium]